MESSSIPANVRLAAFQCIKFKKMVIVEIRYVSRDSRPHGCNPISESFDIIRIVGNSMGDFIGMQNRSPIPHAL